MFFHQTGNFNILNKCASKRAGQTLEENRRYKFFYGISKTSDHTQAENTVTSLKFIANGNSLHGVSAIPVKLSKRSDCLASQKRFEEREKKGHTFGIIPQRGDNGRSPKALSYWQLGSCVDFIEANMECCPQESVGVCTRTYIYVHLVKGTRVQECEKFI